MADRDDILGVVTATGNVVDTETIQMRDLPPKRWRVHRWVAIASFILSDEQAEASRHPGGKAAMDGSNLWSLSVGCIDCEKTYDEAAGRRRNGETYIDPGARRG